MSEKVSKLQSERVHAEIEVRSQKDLAKMMSSLAKVGIGVVSLVWLITMMTAGTGSTVLVGALLFAPITLIGAAMIYAGRSSVKEARREVEKIDAKITEQLTNDMWD